MTYIDTKTINGKEYMYLRHSIRMSDGRIVHKNVRYLGPVEPIYKKKGKRKDTSRIFVRSLSNQEKDKLSKCKRHESAFIRDRAKIILWSAKGMTCISISEKLGCDVRKVRSAVKDFNKRGIDSLIRRKAKGAEPKFTEEDRKKILEKFSKDPKEFDYTFTSWTLPRFREHLIKQGVVDSICIETVRQIILKAGAKLTPSKRWQYSPDKDFDKKNKR